MSEIPNTPVYDGLWKYNSGCADLHQLSSHQASGGGQDLVVVLSGEFSLQRVSLHLPRSLRLKHTVVFTGISRDFCTVWSPNGPSSTHRDLGAVGQSVVELDAQREVDLFGAEGARLLDVELVAGLLDDDLQVIVFGDLSLHHVNPFIEANHKYPNSSFSLLISELSEGKWR